MIKRIWKNMIRSSSRQLPIDIPVSIKNRQKLFKVDLKRIRRSMKKLLKELHCDDREISLLLVDDNQIKILNSVYLNRNNPTNVLSFAMTEGEFGNINPRVLGDIVISVETASRDASISHFDLMDELEFLIIHGLLHLLGYNHENDSTKEAIAMNDCERKLFFLLRGYYIDW
jgi:probable rRNA maturation factor